MPLRLVEQNVDQSHFTADGKRKILTYAVDTKLLQKTEALFKRGYNKCQDNVPDWLRKKGLLGSASKEARDALLSKWMFVKSEKPNSCYHYDMFLEDLDQMSSEDFALCIRGQPTELNCRTAVDLLWNVPTRFKSVMSFRELVVQTYQHNPELLKQVKDAPIMLLDPIKQIYGHKFTYQLTELSKNPNRKQEYRKEVKKKNLMTSS